ncbi:MAG: AsmA family protein [Deltaproteobacteria bacterium]|nr:AsmA family protein [Deltaproteobacteria bacterium]
MKKALTILIILFSLVFLAVLIVPHFINFNSIKNKILVDVNQSIKGRIEAGEVKVSWLGGLRFQIPQVALYADKQSPEPILHVPSFNTKVSVLSLIFFSPSISFFLDHPKFYIIQDQNKKLNVMRAFEALDMPSEKPSSEQIEKKPWALLAKAKISLKTVAANIHFVDQTTNTEKKIENLDLVLKGLGLNSTFSYSVHTNLSYNSQIEGHVALKGKARLGLDKDYQLSSIDLYKLVLDLTKARIRYKNYFDKKEDEKFIINLAGAYDFNKKLRIQNAKIVLADSKFDAKGLLSAEKFDFSFSTNKLLLEKLKLHSPLLSDWDARGECTSQGSLEGSLESPDYQASFQFKNTSLHLKPMSPTLKNIQGNIKLKKDLLTLGQFHFNLGSSFIKASGKIENFTLPVADFSIESSHINMNEISFAKTAHINSWNNFLLPLAIALPASSNPSTDFLQKLKAFANLKIDKVTIGHFSMDQVKAVLTFKDMVAELNNFQFQMLDGTFKSHAKIKDLFQKYPYYEFSGNVVDLDMNKFLTTLSPQTKDVLKGKLNGDFSVRSRGESFEQILSSLFGNGEMKINNGSFSTLKISEAIRQNLKNDPRFKDSPIFHEEFGEDFKTSEAEFEVQQNIIKVSKMKMISESYEMTSHGNIYFNQTLDLRGYLRFPARLISNGDLLADDQGQVKLPFTIVGFLSKPRFQIDIVTPLVERLFKKTAEGFLDKFLKIPSPGGPTPSPQEPPPSTP